MNDITERALKTFIQAFGAVVIAGLAGVTDVNALKALLVAALSAGISAAWNIVSASLKVDKEN